MALVLPGPHAAQAQKPCDGECERGLEHSHSRIIAPASPAVNAESLIDCGPQFRKGPGLSLLALVVVLVVVGFPVGRGRQSDDEGEDDSDNDDNDDDDDEGGGNNDDSDDSDDDSVPGLAPGLGAPHSPFGCAGIIRGAG